MLRRVEFYPKRKTDPMTREDWQHLADRLKALEFGNYADVETVLSKILAMHSDELENPDLVRIVCSFIGQELCISLDLADHDPSHETALIAIETEMLGRTLNHALIRGWLVKSETCPPTFPSLDDLS